MVALELGKRSLANYDIDLSFFFFLVVIIFDLFHFRSKERVGDMEKQLIFFLSLLDTCECLCSFIFHSNCIQFSKQFSALSVYYFDLMFEIYILMYMGVYIYIRFQL